MEYLVFFLKDLSFSFVIMTVGFVLGWLIYNHIVLKDVCLRDALFEKDNVAAWIEFIGAFVFPVLFLAGEGIKGSASDNVFVDLAVCTGYTIFYIAILTLLRLLSKYIVSAMNESDSNGKICLNKEIIEQRNVGAALFSVSLSIIFVIVIRYIDLIEIINGNGLSALVKILMFVAFMLVTLVVYTLILRMRTTLFKELFIDNNAAAGVALLGFVFAAQTIVDGAISLYEKDFHILTVAVVIAIALLIFGILSVLFKVVFTKLIKVNIWKEIYEQNSTGAALGQAALYIGIANIIISFLK